MHIVLHIFVLIASFSFVNGGIDKQLLNNVQKIHELNQKIHIPFSPTLKLKQSSQIPSKYEHIQNDPSANHGKVPSPVIIQNGQESINGPQKESSTRQATQLMVGHDDDKDLESSNEREYSNDLEGQPCFEDAECQLVNFNIALAFNSTLVHSPYCKSNDNYSTNGTCTCGEYCISYSNSYEEDVIFYYCGPCGRIGSVCPSPAEELCTHQMSECSHGFCHCQGGKFYNLYYCFLPYNGYEKALQVAIGTCIFVTCCLLMASIYSNMYRRGQVPPYLMRFLSPRNEGTRESPPGDTPPKYDDVIAEDQPPSYEDALELERAQREMQAGADNPAYESDGERPARGKDEDNKSSAGDSDAGYDDTVSSILLQGATDGNDRESVTIDDSHSASSDIATDHRINDETIDECKDSVANGTDVIKANDTSDTVVGNYYENTIGQGDGRNSCGSSNGIEAYTVAIVVDEKKTGAIPKRKNDFKKPSKRAHKNTQSRELDDSNSNSGGEANTDSNNSTVLDAGENKYVNADHHDTVNETITVNADHHDTVNETINL